MYTHSSIFFDINTDIKNIILWWYLLSTSVDPIYKVSRLEYTFSIVGLLKDNNNY